MRANRLSKSVKLTTPFKWPPSVAPGSDEADTEMLGVAGVYGGPWVVDESCESTGGGAVAEGPRCGEGGMEEVGEGASTIHMR